jgi:hypothetical protein
VIFHSNSFKPTPNNITCELGEVGVTTNPGPLTTFHTPIPTTGVLPAKLAVDVFAQTDWVGPALETVGFASRCIETVEVEFAQTPFPIVHWNTFTPTPKVLTALVGNVGVAIVPAPETKLHVPVPIAGVFPFKFAVVAQTI